MTHAIVANEADPWQRLKQMVLDSVSAPITRRVCKMALEEFFAWSKREPRPGFDLTEVLNQSE